MIKASRPVPAGLFSMLEDRLCELAPSSWFLMVNRLTGKGSLEGYFESEGEAFDAWPDLADLFAPGLQAFVYKMLGSGKHVAGPPFGGVSLVGSQKRICSDGQSGKCQ